MYNDEIIYVLIVNNHFVRWESEKKNTSIKNLYNNIYKKYCLPKNFVLEVNDKVLHYSSEPLKKYCKNGEIVIRLFTTENLNNLIEIVE